MPDKGMEETLLTLTECARALPKVGGRKIHPSSLWRWARRGLKGERLKYRKFGGRIVITLADVATFTERLAELDDLPTDRTTPKPTRCRTSKQRERDIKAAQKTLMSAGIIP